ncbi:MAG: sigma-70 family RNA polymerase sigma factor [Anaerolineae bacterium]|nr:sigma-70 family RNA polymerase sigma factor [Anaerolineae bacterium]
MFTDQDYVEATLQGDTSAFNELVLRYQHQVFNFAYHMLGNHQDGEEAAQESFCRAYCKLRSYDPAQPFKRWLLAITAHYCIDILRQRRGLWYSIDELLDGEGSSPEPHGYELTPEEACLNREMQVEFTSLLHILPVEQRAIVLMHYWDDLSYTEIADALGITISSVKSRLFRARQTLAHHLRFQHGDALPSYQHARAGFALAL